MIFEEIESFIWISTIITFWSRIEISIDISTIFNWILDSLSHNFKIFVRRQIECEKACMSNWESFCTKVIGVLNLMLVSQLAAIKRNFWSSPNELKILASLFLCKVAEHFPKDFNNWTVFLNASVLCNFLEFFYWDFFQSASS